jgi:hypothetical protein
VKYNLSTSRLVNILHAYAYPAPNLRNKWAPNYPEAFLLSASLAAWCQSTRHVNQYSATETLLLRVSRVVLGECK